MTTDGPMYPPIPNCQVRASDTDPGWGKSRDVDNVSAHMVRQTLATSLIQVGVSRGTFGNVCPVAARGERLDYGLNNNCRPNGKATRDCPFSTFMFSNSRREN